MLGFKARQVLIIKERDKEKKTQSGSEKETEWEKNTETQTGKQRQKEKETKRDKKRLRETSAVFSDSRVIVMTSFTSSILRKKRKNEKKSERGNKE